MKKLFVLFFLFPLALLAAPPVFQGNGVCRFILHDYSLPKENEDKINFIVSDLLQRHEELFGFTNPDLHVRIHIFGRFDDYATFATTNYGGVEGEHLSQEITNLAGYYSVHDNTVVTWRQRDPTYLANNILHECSHAIMHQQFRALPIWLDEGCAVYFQFPNFMRSESAARRLDYQWFELEQWRKENSLPPLRPFLNINPQEFRAQDPAKTYPVSWSLFQFLAGTPENQRVMNALLQECQKKDSSAFDCAIFLDAAYPGGVGRMEKDWHAWIARGAANVLAKYRKP